MTARYAIYFVPAQDSILWRFGRTWLGRCGDRDEPVAQPIVAGIDPALLREITEAPRLYGWHATLKPPFALAANRSADELAAAVRDFARVRAPIRGMALRLESLGDFLALTPTQPSPVLHDLAAACVKAFDPFRAPAREDELARRRAAGLTPRQEALLARWGYPHVMDEFRFHMTLTGPLSPALRRSVAEALDVQLEPVLRVPLEIDQLALCRQEGAGKAFEILSRYPLQGISASNTVTNRAMESLGGVSLQNGMTSGPDTV